MKTKFRKIIGALSLLMLFTMYQVNVVAFTHVHYVNGTPITHSHPFNGTHSHSSAQYLLIARLSTFNSTEPMACVDLQPLCQLLHVVERDALSQIWQAEAGRGVSLRAPPGGC